MKEDVNKFYQSFENADKFSNKELVELFVYFITIIQNKGGAKASDVEKCFKLCDLSVPNSLKQILSNGTSSKSQTLIKAEVGYRLVRAVKDRISSRIGENTLPIKTHKKLRNLENLLQDDFSKFFLKEVVDCFEVGARRSSIIMCWILSMNHLYGFVYQHKRNEFNAILKNNTDKRVKIDEINSLDDFSEIPEGKFIEFCRSAKIITNDVRKILDEKLGITEFCRSFFWYNFQ